MGIEYWRVRIFFPLRRKNIPDIIIDFSQNQRKTRKNDGGPTKMSLVVRFAGTKHPDRNPGINSVPANIIHPGLVCEVIHAHPRMGGCR